MTKILVTGGAGFIGSQIVLALLKDGHEVHVLDSLVAKRPVPAGTILHKVDVRDIEACRDVFEEQSPFDFVFLLAALPSVQYSLEHPAETNAVNLLGTLNMLELSARHGVKRFIYSSSCSIYGDQEKLPVIEITPAHPKSPYALEKYASELYCRLTSETKGLGTVCLRYFNVYGLGMKPDDTYAAVVGIFLKNAKEGKPLTIIGDGEQTRDFINVRDVAQANLLAMTSDKVGNGEPINIGSGVATSINALAATIGGEIQHLPPRLELKDSQADISLAKKLLSWQPTIALEDGLEELKENSGV